MIRRNNVANRIIAVTLLSLPVLVVAQEQGARLKDFDPRDMCLNEGKAFSLGSRIEAGGAILECARARPDSYYVDRDHDARWIPTALAESQQKRGT